MAETIHCETHGETSETFVCDHLADLTAAGLGFNRNEPSEDNPYPDAWCDDCEVIREAHQGWNEDSEKLVTFHLLCSGCYERSRIQYTQTNVTLDDLASLRWKCHSCEEWHSGPCLDFSYGAPVYWEDDMQASEFPLSLDPLPAFYLDDDLCIIDGEHFFVRGIIQLPIIGTCETFRWGVWGSLSKDNFQKLVSVREDSNRRVELPPMFSWLSNEIEDYEDTLNLKMYAHVNEPRERPTFELEPTDHPLSQEYYDGITAERVKKIMSNKLLDVLTDPTDG